MLYNPKKVITNKGAGASQKLPHQFSMTTSHKNPPAFQYHPTGRFLLSQAFIFDLPSDPQHQLYTQRSYFTPCNDPFAFIILGAGVSGVFSIPSHSQVKISAST